LNWTSLRLTLNRKLLRKELNAGRRRATLRNQAADVGDDSDVTS